MSRHARGEGIAEWVKANEGRAIRRPAGRVVYVVEGITTVPNRIPNLVAIELRVQGAPPEVRTQTVGFSEVKRFVYAYGGAGVEAGEPVYERVDS